jgi:heptosyltransferase-2
MKRILVRSPNWIGDQVLAFPFYRTLRERYPEAWIAVVCTEWVRDIQFRGLVDEVFVLPKRKEDSTFHAFKKIWNFAKSLKQKGPWDLGITLPNSFGSALLMYLCGAKNRRGYVADARGFLLNEKIEWNPSHEIHRSQAYLNLLADEGLPSHQAQDYWKFSGDSRFDPIRYWPDILPIEPPKVPYFIVAPGATADTRRWSAEQFSSFIGQATRKFGLKAVIVGGNAEKVIAAKFFKDGVLAEDYTGRGWVAAHWKLFREAKFTVCNESGLAHVAALCGSPVQIICGAADPRRTKPIGPGSVQVKVNPVECWPCEKNICQFQDERKNQCLVGITPTQIIEEVELGFLVS